MTLAVVGRIDQTFPLHGWSGWLHGLKDEPETFARLGETGSGAQILRTRGPESPVQAMRICASLADALTAAEQAEAWQAQVLRVVDPFGRSFLRVRFNEVSVSVRGCRGNGPDATSAAARVMLDLRLEVLPDA